MKFPDLESNQENNEVERGWKRELAVCKWRLGDASQHQPEPNFVGDSLVHVFAQKLQQLLWVG